jgi:hypothetical protein
MTDAMVMDGAGFDGTSGRGRAEQVLRMCCGRGKETVVVPWCLEENRCVTVSLSRYKGLKSFVFCNFK